MNLKLNIGFLLKVITVICVGQTSSLTTKIKKTLFQSETKFLTLLTSLEDWCTKLTVITFIVLKKRLDKVISSL